MVMVPVNDCPVVTDAGAVILEQEALSVLSVMPVRLKVMVWVGTGRVYSLEEGRQSMPLHVGSPNAPKSGLPVLMGTLLA